MNKDVAPKPLASMGKDLSGKPFLQALAAREELVRNGKLTCVVFVRDINSKGQEISGYIDFAHRRVASLRGGESRMLLALNADTRCATRGMLDAHAATASQLSGGQSTAAVSGFCGL